MDTGICPLCERKAGMYRNLNNGTILYKCKNCGHFYSSEECEDMMMRHEQSFMEKRHLVAGITRQRTDNGERELLFTTSNLADYYTSTDIPKNVPERSERLLRFMYSHSKDSLVDFRLEKDIFPAHAYARDINELARHFRILEGRGLVEKGTGSLIGLLEYHLTYQGFGMAKELKPTAVSQRDAFAAMWFDPSMTFAFTGAIRPATAQCGYGVNRVDFVEFNDDIDGKIAELIKSSPFVIADFTGNRGGVYFEAGFARALGVPVIYTCRTDWFDVTCEERATIIEGPDKKVTGIIEVHRKVHFDVDHFKFIQWETVDELRTKLVARITQTIGKR